MKIKLIGTLLTLCMTVTMITAQAAVTLGEIQDIVVKVNDKAIAFDVKPMIINDRTMVPLRAIFEAHPCKV